MPQVFKLRTGELVEYPDGPLTADEIKGLQFHGGAPYEAPAAKEPQGMEKVSDVIQSAASGTVEGGLRGPLWGGDVLHLGLKGLKKLAPNAINNPDSIPTQLPQFTDKLGGPSEIRFGSDEIMKAANAATGFTPHKPTSRAGQYADSISQAIAAAITGGGVGGAFRGLATMGKATLANFHPASLLVNGSTGAAAEAARGMSDDPVLPTLAAIATGAGGNAARSLMSSPFRQQISRAGHETTPDQWQTAKEQAQRFDRLGARSAILPDSLPPGNSFGPLATELSNAPGGEVLRQRLDPQRKADLVHLISQARDATNPGQPANGPSQLPQFGQRAKTIISELENNNRAAQTETMRWPEAQPSIHDLQTEANTLHARSMNDENIRTVSQPAYNAAALALDPTAPIRLRGFSMSGIDPQFIPPQANVPQFSGPGTGLGFPGGTTNATEPQVPRGNLVALNQRVGMLKAPRPGAQLTSSSQVLQAEPQIRAANAADDALRRVAPDYGLARDQYDQFRNQVLTPLNQGPVGQFEQGVHPSTIAQNNPQSEFKASVPLVAPQPEMRRQLARVMAEGDAGHQGLHYIPDSSVPNAEPGLRVRQGIADALGPQNLSNTTAMNENLSAADRLSQLSAKPGENSQMQQSLAESLGTRILRPINSAVRTLRLANTEDQTRVIADLLANPTVGNNMKRLQEMSQSNPQLARLLARRGMLGAIGVSALPQAPQQQQQQPAP